MIFYACLFSITSPATSFVCASPLSIFRSAVFARQAAQPYFPDTPASCPICAQGYPRINSCAAAAPVLANFSLVIFNPGAFISVIKCACTDTFQSVFPQCADCFERTNQTAVLDSANLNLPSLVKNLRQLCEMESSLLGNASNTDGETTPSPSAAASTGSTGGASLRNVPGLSSVVAGAVALVIFGASLL